MPTPALSAPWRIDYIRSLRKSDEPEGCFLCAAATTADETASLVLWRSELSVVLMNRFPYANGHLMACPKRHVGDFEELTVEELTDMNVQTARAIRLLKRAVSAQGFNVGLNLGRVAGAGVPGHLHQHVVPRWGGDVNFIHVVGEVGIIPQATSRLYEELREMTG